MSASNKFVDLREYRIRDYQKEGIIRPVWIPGTLNPADLFTKLLGRTLFMQNTRLLGMSTTPSESLIDEQNRDSCLYSMANKSHSKTYDLLKHYPSGQCYFISG